MKVKKTKPNSDYSVHDLHVYYAFVAKKKKVSKLRARLFKKFQLIRSNVQKYKNAIWSNNSTSGHISKKN